MLALAVLGLACGLFLGYFAWRLHRSEQALIARPVVPGRMLQIAVEAAPKPAVSTTATSQNQMYWQVKLRYVYEVAGQGYSGDRLSNQPPLEHVDRHRQPSPALTQYLERYPVGSTVQVRYDPGNPTRSVLEVATGGARGFTMAAAAAAALSAFGFVCWLLGWPPRR